MRSFSACRGLNDHLSPHFLKQSWLGICHCLHLRILVLFHPGMGVEQRQLLVKKLLRCSSSPSPSIKPLFRFFFFYYLFSLNVLLTLPVRGAMRLMTIDAFWCFLLVWAF